MTPSVSSIEKWILQKIHASISRPAIRLALGRGPEVGPTDIEPVASVFISNWNMLTRLLLNPEVGTPSKTLHLLDCKLEVPKNASS